MLASPCGIGPFLCLGLEVVYRFRRSKMLVILFVCLGEVQVGSSGFVPMKLSPGECTRSFFFSDLEILAPVFYVPLRRSHPMRLFCIFAIPTVFCDIWTNFRSTSCFCENTKTPGQASDRHVKHVRINSGPISLKWIRNLGLCAQK